MNTSANLTNPNPTISQQVRMSHPGMAHFAGTGPADMTCRLCRHWTGCGKDTGYYAGLKGTLKPRPCDQYRKLMQEIGGEAPHDAPACRHFVANPNPPPAFKRYA
jgi:hypothetical protein